MAGNVIFEDDCIIGFAWDIESYLKTEMAKITEGGELDEDDEAELAIDQELFDKVSEYDDLVICEWHPMGAWHVERLYRQTWFEGRE